MKSKKDHQPSFHPMKNKVVILFDDTCPLCLHSVRFLLKIDHKGLFLFAPLAGKTAKKLLKNEWKSTIAMNSLVLLENKRGHKRWYRSRAVFRSFWLLGGGWTLLGSLSFLPSWALDPFYRLMARHRHHLVGSKVHPRFSKEEQKRFLT